jgi:hypothetical protein
MSEDERQPNGWEGSGITKVPYRSIPVGGEEWQEYLTPKQARQKDPERWRDYFPSEKWLENQLQTARQRYQAAIDKTEPAFKALESLEGNNWHADLDRACRAQDAEPDLRLFRPHEGFGWFAEAMLTQLLRLSGLIKFGDCIETAICACSLATLMTEAEMKFQWEAHALRGEKIRQAASEGGRRQRVDKKATAFETEYLSGLNRGVSELIARQKAARATGIDQSYARRLAKKIGTQPA